MARGVSFASALNMIVLILVVALHGDFIGGHMVKSDIHHGIHSTGQLIVESVVTEQLITELSKSLAFDPPSLDFEIVSIGTAKSQMVTLVNKDTNRSVHLTSISGKTSDFYSSFFEDKIVPPQGNTTFNIVFLPRNIGILEANLLIHTSFGQALLKVKGEGRECPYRLKPLIGIQAPLNATVTPEIVMYNPHATSIQILEIYSSGGQFQLELPSGGQEGPQALWEIPPYTSKTIIRIRFHGAEAGNYSAYIRIKISGNPERPEESVLVVPVEFQIQASSGIYSRNPVIDFGRTTTKDIAKKLNLNFVNSGKESLEITDYKLKSVNGLIELQKSHNTLILNSDYAKEDTIIDGELIIKTQNKNSAVHFMELSVGIRAEIFHGTLEFEKNLTVFITGARNYTNESRDFFVQNTFKVPLAITHLTVEKNDSSIFILKDFKPLILTAGEKVKLFQIAVLNNMVNFSSILRIITNITQYELPIVICSGRLNRFTSLDPMELTPLPEEQVLDFGTVPFGDHSNHGYILIMNRNPVPLKLLQWNFTNPRGIFYNAVFLGCSPETIAEESTELPKKAVDRFRYCVNIPANGTGGFLLSVQSFNVNTFAGVFNIWTEVEEITTNVKFVTVMGRLSVDQIKLQFNNCFPGKRCTADLAFHSTFVKTMRVKAITVSVPGLIFEYNTVFQNGLPEIMANEDTSIGRIHFDPKTVCGQKCYIPQEGDAEAEPFIKNRRDLNETELRRRTESFRRFKWNLQEITFTLDTTEVRHFEFNASVEIVWPKLVKAPVTLPVIEIGHLHEGSILLTNPSSEKLHFFVSLSDPKRAKSISLSLPLEVVDNCAHCFLTDHEVFWFRDKNVERSSVVLPPNSQVGIPLNFMSQEAGQFSTLLHIRNNLTLYEAVWITGKTVKPQFRFGNRKPGSPTPLLFEITERHLSSCDKSENPDEPTMVSSKRTFTARNSGEVRISVLTFRIGDKECEGYGFKILDCQPFELKANESKRIDIAFTPDFTMTRISRPLIIFTNLSTNVNYTLLATVPASSLEICSKSLMRPTWEVFMKYMAVAVLTAAFLFVLIAAFLDSDKILKDHVKNMSKDKGPIQPPLDFRNMSVRSATVDTTPPSLPDKKVVSSVGSSARKRNVKRTLIPTNNPSVAVNREKAWAEELAKKFIVTPKITENNSVKEVGNSKGSNSSPPQQKPKESVEKQKKVSAKEIIETQNISRSPAVEKCQITELMDETYEQKIESSPTETRKAKLPLKKTKSNNSGQNSQVEIRQIPSDPSPPLRNTELPKSSKRSQKEKSESLNSQPNNSSTTASSDSPTLNESLEKSLKLTPNQRKYGKTPGRERLKKEPQQNRKTQKFKGTAFQFSSPISSSGSSTAFNNTGTNIWDQSQASFSQMAQKALNMIDGNERKHFADQPHDNYHHRHQDTNNNGGHEWNEADLKNYETFGSDAEPPTRDSTTDLGPIGTRKSPSSTPIWEALATQVHRPTPSMSHAPASAMNNDNSSFFSSNFPIAARTTTYDYTTGGASGLLDHLITDRSQHQQRQWQTGNLLLSLLQQREQQNGIRSSSSGAGGGAMQQNWPPDRRTWTPMGYQDSTTSTAPPLTDELNSMWQQRASSATVRPPPGLGVTAINPNHSSSQLSQSVQNQRQHQLQTLHSQQNESSSSGSNMQTFDPFLSSIWSTDPWNNSDKKQN